MTSDQKTSFLTYYVRSLAERTRVEKSGTKIGFDWVIYNLALAADWTPQRLPFLRGGADEYSKTKTENEYGIDFAFLSNDRRTLHVFVLKDEVLNSQNWTKHSFDGDLRKAAAPNLQSQEVRDVREVRIILGYNKDDDSAGIELFDRLTANLGTKAGDNATLSFGRWNLTTITEKVRDTLLTPSLLPQAFFSQFGYLCSQFGDFVHGSDEWAYQLVPNWLRFLDDLLKDDPDERSVRLLPVALMILREHSGSNPTGGTGWIDLMEWAMLAAWRVHQATAKGAVKQAIEEMWLSFYVAELGRYYGSQQMSLAVEGSLDKHGGGLADAVASAMVSHWHVARIGILGIAISEVHHAKKDDAAAEAEANCNSVANVLVGLLNANSSAMRPILDIHHIEMFLIWATLWKVGRLQDIFSWLLQLEDRLFMRRTGKAGLPFIDGSNSLESVFEFAATGERPPEFCDGSSVFLACMLELCFSLPVQERDILLRLIYQRLVLANDDDGKRWPNSEPIDLMLWMPPGDWGERVLLNSIAHEGNCITINHERLSTANHENFPLAERIGRFVESSRKMNPFKRPEGLPASVIILACLKHGTPLPPELWRRPIFGPVAHPGTAGTNADCSAGDQAG